LRILMINPNTSVAITERLAARVRAIAGADVTVLPVTGRFGATYIASRAAALIAGHAALDALAAHVADCDAVYLACFGDPEARRAQGSLTCAGCGDGRSLHADCLPSRQALRYRHRRCRLGTDA
jgi:Asp/Glu/hydantoin racemase